MPHYVRRIVTTVVQFEYWDASKGQNPDYIEKDGHLVRTIVASTTHVSTSDFALATESEAALIAFIV